MLYAEHSPIRLLKIKWRWEDLKTWVSTHFVRHSVGYTKFVESQRSDREHTNIYNRDERPQAAPVSQYNEANAQAVINISRKRLCRQSHAETRQAWQLMLDEMKELEPELYKVCVPECVRCGFCPEYESCGYIESRQGISQREGYIDLLRNVREGIYKNNVQIINSLDEFEDYLREITNSKYGFRSLKKDFLQSNFEAKTELEALSQLENKLPAEFFTVDENDGFYVFCPIEFEEIQEEG